MRSRIRRSPQSKPKPGNIARRYFPASRLAVIKPTLSMPELRMMSMALATSAKRTASSPLTKATFSARSLKTSERRGPSVSQVASSSLIFSFPVSSNLHHDRLLLECVCCCFWFGGAGCGTSASRPFRRQRRDDHENNDQHQENIDQRHDVHRRHRTAFFSSYVHSHCRISLFQVPRRTMPSPGRMSEPRSRPGSGAARRSLPGKD